MGRIEQTFQRLKEEGRKGLVGYLTAGDPDYETSLRNIRTAVECGVDILELGVPFSDATADGPIIQAASHRALAAGMTVPKALAIVREIRRDHDLPIILFGYANPFFHYGYERLAADAVEAGADGMLVVDMPHEESAELQGALEAQGLSFINLIAPTTPPERARTILNGASGFAYYIMVTGVTGARTQVAADIDQHVDRLRECTDLPIAVGFGVSSGEQARAVGQSADAVVVGSALVRAAQAGGLADLVKELCEALSGE